MSNSFDFANDIAERDRGSAVANRAAVEIDAGKPGDCDLCGEWASRLVDGACVPCRDKYEKRNKRGNHETI